MSNSALLSSSAMPALDDISAFQDLKIGIEVQVDHCHMTLREVIELDEGSVIKLPRSAGDNMDVFVGDSLIGHGEVVIFDDKIGIRITDFREE